VNRVVGSIDRDARGIVDPGSGAQRFTLDRHAPSPSVGRFVDRYWIVSWDLTGQPPYTQRVFAHPVVNVVFEAGEAIVTGVTTRMSARTLEGSGRVLGVMFRPAGFHAVLGRPMSGITDRVLPFADLAGPRAGRAARQIAGAARAADQAAMVAAADELMAALLPGPPQPCEETTAIAERCAADPAMARVDALAELAGLSPRQLQRRFAEHVGVSPKAVIRRYRLYEAAERARLGDAVDWAALAAELGYSDQAHLVRDFSAAFGVPPERYARAAGTS
jgi:AraC-like DNA-binding protein